LDVSRIEAGRVILNMESLDLAPLCEEVVNEIRRRSRSEGKPMQVNLNAEESNLQVSGDRQRLRQVLANLAGNAYHYTPPGGEIDLHLYRQGSEIIVDVQDNGIGILPQHQARLFERFYRGDDPLVLASPGTGLGLSIVKSLVEMHNGRIWFTSSGKRGEGTVFSIALPALESKN
jgi:signal transduction histidine kinase